MKGEVRRKPAPITGTNHPGRMKDKARDTMIGTHFSVIIVSSLQGLDLTHDDGLDDTNFRAAFPFKH
jgi:hypothetical protein